MSNVSPRPPLKRLAAVYLRVGNFTFGGGAPTVAALQRELVSREWIDTEQFGLTYAVSRITPGTNLLAFCTATGWLMRRWRGAILAVLAASIPSCALVALVTRGFDTWSSQRLVQIAIEGALAASVGILLASFWSVISPYLQRGRRTESALIVAASFALSLLTGLSPVLVLILAGVAGFFLTGRVQS